MQVEPIPYPASVDGDLALSAQDAVPTSVAARENATLASYALRSVDSAGRDHAEPPHAYRGPFQRDRDRIVHCSAFRRLSSKTQVFAGTGGDYHRTRLTHTLEVASIARTLARGLALNEDLVEALALLHDLGHPPFGHAGEEVLNHCMRDEGGFNHNEHALRIVRRLERVHSDYPGLNLSREVVEGQQHRGAHVSRPSAHANCSPLLEAQVVDAADSIAYDTHDTDDALALGLVGMDDLLRLPLWKEAAARSLGNGVQGTGEESSALLVRRLVVRALVDDIVSDVLGATRERIAAAGIDSVIAVRRHPTLVRPTSELGAKKEDLEQFLLQRVYRHPTLLADRASAQDALRQLFDHYLAHPSELPTWQARLPDETVPRVVTDWLAGLTDRGAWREVQRLSRGRVENAADSLAVGR